MALLVLLAGGFVLRELGPKPATTPVATVPASTSQSQSAPPNPTGTPAATPTLASAAAPRRPQAYVLPSECQYVDNGTVDGSATAWKISCPQGLPSNYLRPSLGTQGWTSCGTKVWQKDALQIAIIDATNVSGFSGWLDQRQLNGSSCVQPTPPPNSGGSTP